MTDALRRMSDEAFEALEYFTPRDLEVRLRLDGYSESVITRVMHGFFSVGHRTIRQVAELPNETLHRPHWTGVETFVALENSIAHLLTYGTEAID